MRERRTPNVVSRHRLHPPPPPPPPPPLLSSLLFSLKSSFISHPRTDRRAWRHHSSYPGREGRRGCGWMRPNAHYLNRCRRLSGLWRQHIWYCTGVGKDKGAREEEGSSAPAELAQRLGDAQTTAVDTAAAGDSHLGTQVLNAAAAAGATAQRGLQQPF